MISLADLAALALDHQPDLSSEITDMRIGEERFDTDRSPVVMGTINLSRDSTYRESVAVSTDSAIRKGRVLAAEGAQLVDIGAESTTARAKRVGPDRQAAAIVPVVKQLAADGIALSVETYEPTVAAAGLDAGAAVVNMTGVEHEEAMLDLVAAHRASVILCYSGGRNAREITDLELDSDPIPMLLDHFSERIDRARSRGVEGIAIDPGMGFYYGNLTDPVTRARHQARVLLNAFRLRPLGRPICNALPHAFDLFEESFRTAEGFFAVLARLGGSGILRTHEVPQVRSVVLALETLDVS